MVSLLGSIMSIILGIFLLVAFIDSKDIIYLIAGIIFGVMGLYFMYKSFYESNPESQEKCKEVEKDGQ